MTPIAERLAVLSEEEVRRMRDKWFFKWHHIGGIHAVEIDNFRGDFIRYGGLVFDGTARLVYWDTITFYLRQEITKMFGIVEAALQKYPLEVRSKAITECEPIIHGFAGQIRNISVETDRILRGDGINFPPRDETNNWVDSESHSISRRSDGLREVYCIFPAS